MTNKKLRKSVPQGCLGILMEKMLSLAVILFFIGVMIAFAMEGLFWLFILLIGLGIAGIVRYYSNK